VREVRPLPDVRPCKRCASVSVLPVDGPVPDQPTVLVDE
jgi:hypothetical protein